MSIVKISKAWLKNENQDQQDTSIGLDKGKTKIEFKFFFFIILIIFNMQYSTGCMQTYRVNRKLYLLKSKDRG